MKLKLSTWLSYLEEQYGDRPAISTEPTIDIVDKIAWCLITVIER